MFDLDDVAVMQILNSQSCLLLSPLCVLASLTLYSKFHDPESRITSLILTLTLLTQSFASGERVAVLEGLSVLSHTYVPREPTLTTRIVARLLSLPAKSDRYTI
jgi:hypothetical protein